MYEGYHVRESELESLPGKIIKSGLFLIQLTDHPCIKDGNFANGRYIVNVFVEDDETWLFKMEFASFWMPDLLKVLNQVPMEKP
jgi:hypothetical protein